MYTITYIEHGETFELTPTTILPSYQHPLPPGPTIILPTCHPPLRSPGYPHTDSLTVYWSRKTPGRTGCTLIPSRKSSPARLLLVHSLGQSGQSTTVTVTDIHSVFLNTMLFISRHRVGYIQYKNKHNFCIFYNK